MTSRVKGKKSITDIVLDINRRLKAGETSLRIGNTAIEDGNLVVRNGDIVVSLSDDTEVLRIVHGDTPEIRYFATGIDSDRFGATWGEDVSIDLGSGFGIVDTTVMHTGVYDSTVPEDHDIDGGHLKLQLDGAVFSYEPNNGDAPVYLWLNPYSRVDPFKEVILFNGKWDNQFEYAATSALAVGSVDVGAGFGSYSWTYQQAYATRICPVVGLVNSGAVVTSWNVTSMNTSGFTVTWTGALAKVINWWNFRV
jgi:hypothetical protein